jgi:hypothetical protein
MPELETSVCTRVASWLWRVAAWRDGRKCEIAAGAAMGAPGFVAPRSSRVPPASEQEFTLWPNTLD